MIPVAQLDPASLALWVNLEMIRRSPNFRHYEPVIDAAGCGNLDAVSETINQIEVRRTAVRALHLASLFWHEQRHFLDLTVTNYGARHFRDTFTVTMNTRALIGDQLEAGATELLVPIERYRTLPSALRPSTVAPSVLAQADDIRHRRAILRQDRVQIPTPKGPAVITGESMLEALGFLSQHWSVFQMADGEAALAVLRDVPERLQRSLTYEWPILVAQALRMAPDDVLAGYPLIPGARLLAAMLLAALFGPWLDTSRPYVRVTDRFSRLLIRLAGDLAADLFSSSFTECWGTVSAMCRDEWGRTPLEELEADLEHEERLVTLLQDRRAARERDWDLDFFLRYHSNRRLALDAVRADPMILDPTAGPDPSALPVPVSVVPTGHVPDLPESHMRLFGIKIPIDKSPATLTWAYSPMSWPPPGTLIGFEPDDNWRMVVTVGVPTAKLMLNGLRHRTMLGPELWSAQSYLGPVIDLRVDPHWSYSPTEETALDQALFLAETEHLPCDVCRQPVHVDNGRIVSPMELRSDPESIRAAGEAFAVKLTGFASGEERAQAGLDSAGAFDWSHWIVCSVCIDRLRPQRKAAKSDAERFASDAARLAESPGLAAHGLLAKAFAVRREGKHPEAIALYEQALATGDPSVAPIAAYGLGMMYVAAGDLRRAEAAYRVAIDPRWPVPDQAAAFNLGNMLEGRGDREEAAWAYGHATTGADDEIRSRAYLRRGMCVVLRDGEQALEDFTKVIESDVNAADVQRAWAGIGALRANQDRRPEALAAWEKAVAGPSDEAAVYAAKGAIMYAVQWEDEEAGTRFSTVMNTRGGAHSLDEFQRRYRLLLERAAEDESAS
jgi:tetratricopeptide (TPR) repeat protein